MIKKKLAAAFQQMETSAHAANWSGKIERFNTLELYRAIFPENAVYNLHNIFTHDGVHYEGVSDALTSQGWELVKNDTLFYPKKNTNQPYHQTWVHPSGCLADFKVAIKSPGGLRRKASVELIEFWVGDHYISDMTEDASGVLVMTDLIIIEPLMPAENISSMIEDFKKSLKPYKEKKSAKIGIVSHDGREYYVKDFSLEGKVPSFEHADLHYGEGFEEFHGKMVQRIINETKGLVLLHGEPGTGKTQYIRVLLDLISGSGKRVLYVPPSFASHMLEPTMIDFISDWVMEEDGDAIMLIEDAEPLLETRSGDGRSTGISNLLNMTDGIINDMLGLLVIATFNTDLERIDSALLRPQRLLARKEFFRITKENAEKLSKALGMELPDITYPATLAEFYTVKKSQEVLVHGLKEKKPSIGFGRN